MLKKLLLVLVLTAILLVANNNSVAAQEDVMSFGCVVPMDAYHLRIYFGYTANSIQTIDVSFRNNLAIPFDTLRSTFVDIPEDYTSEFFITLQSADPMEVLEITLSSPENTIVYKYHTIDFQPCSNAKIDNSPPPGPPAATPEPTPN